MPRKLPVPEQPEIEGLPEGAVLRFVRSGGLRPANEELVMFADGRVQVTRGMRRQASERVLPPDEVRKVVGDAALAGFFEMGPEVGEQRPDGFAYELTIRSGERPRMVVLYDGSVPPAFAPVLANLRGMTRV